MRMYSVSTVLVAFVGIQLAQAGSEPLLSLDHGVSVGFLAFSPDGKTLASGGGNGHANIRLWDLGERELIAEMDFHRAGLTGLAFTPDGKQIVSGGWDALVCLWDVSTGREVRRFDGHAEGVTGVAISPDGKLLATSSIDGTARLFDLGSGKQLRHYVARQRDRWDRVMAVAFTADGAALATSDDREGGVRLWDVATGKEVHRPGPSKTSAPARRFYQGLQGARYQGNFVADHDRFRRAGLGVQLRQFGGHPQRSFDHFAPDGRTLAYAVSTRGVLLEAATGEDRLELVRPETVTAVAFAPDGRHLASAEGKEGAVHLWNIDDIAGIRKPAGKLSVSQLDKCWTSLNGTAANAYRASLQLALSPDAAVPFLVERALSRLQPDDKLISALIDDLDGPNFTVRQRAADKLEALGPPALSALRKILATDPSLELTLRAERLVVILEERLHSEALRGVRTVEVLERIGTAEAVAALERLARGPASSGPDAEEAAAVAVARLKRAAR